MAVSNSDDEQFRSLLECLPIGVLVIDGDFRISHLNGPARRNFSNAPGPVVGRDFAELTHAIREAQYADEIVRIFRHTLETGEPYARTESASRTDRPSDSFYEWRVERIRMADGRFGLASFFRDISREVRTHELDSFRVALSDALRSLTDPNDVQGTAATLLGTRLGVQAVMYAEVVNREDSDYYLVRQHYHEPDYPDLAGEYRANDFGSTLFEVMRRGETLVVHDLGSEARLSAQEKQAYAALGIQSYIAVPLIKDGRHVALVAVYQSTPRHWSKLEIALVEETAERTWAAAERAKAEVKVRASQVDSARQRRLYEAVLNNTPDLAYVWDLQHRFIYVNDGLLRMWGKTWAEAIGKNCLELGYEPWHAEMHDREIEQIVATKQPVRGEVPFTGTFGRRIYDYILVPVLGPDGEVEAVAGTTRDVTDIKDADRRKDEFLATLAHELRNPLAPIRSAIQVLSLSAHGNAATERVCEMMERQVSHMVRLVDDLLEISRISRGIIELRREQTTLDTIIHSAVDTTTPLIVAAGHQLTLDMPAEPLALYGDPVRLAQVVANLLNNAAKYTSHGGHIVLSAQRKGDELCISVRDDGIGIPAEALSRIFDMFVQLNSGSAHGQGGLGIGLSLVKHLVEMHGGSVSAHSAGLGYGSEFRIRLPCMQVQTDAQVPVAANQPRTELKRRVLVVDDNEDAAQSLAMLIEMLGAEVQVAHDGHSALDMMQSFQPDIALLDIGMPVMNGFELARRVRESPGLEKLTLIALTGWGQPEDRERTKAAGFDHHLVKPAAIPELEALLNATMH